MTPLEQTLARALAEAVKDQDVLFAAWKEWGIFYPVPRWYADATQALAEYSAQQAIERDRISY